jgi:hypothetical protein
VRASCAGRAFAPVFFATLAVSGAAAVLARAALGGLPVTASIAVASAALALLAGVAYAALGVALGTRLPPVLAASVTLGAAVVGAASAGLAPGSSRVLGVVAALVPDLQIFSVAEAAYGDSSGVSLGYVLGVAGWTAAYSAGAVAIGALMLGERELG